MNLFASNSNSSSMSSRKELKATTRDADRTIRKGQREIEKELYDCNKQEKELISKIQAAHKKNKIDEVRSLAKQLVRVREAQTRLQQCTGQLTSVRMNTKAMSANATIVASVAGAAQALAAVNKAVDPAQVMRTMGQFTQEMDKMEVAQESWEDLMDVFDGDGVEEETDGVVNSVLDELGISMGQQLDAAGVVPQTQRAASITAPGTCSNVFQYANSANSAGVANPIV